jgi:hypothetical protein
MKALGSAIVAIIGSVFGVLSLPLFLLNMFGGVVSGIWLMVLGRWGEFVLGIFILFGGSFLIGLVLLPSFGVQSAAAVLMKNKRPIISAILLFLGCLWTYVVMYLWCGVIFSRMVEGAEGHMIPLALWGYANAVGPWGYMASKDREASGSTIAVFAAQLGCAAMMVAVIFLGVQPTALKLAPYLFPFIAFGLLIQTALAIGLAVTATAATWRQEKATRTATAFD